jgi:hypothetical protein
LDILLGLQRVLQAKEALFVRFLRRFCFLFNIPVWVVRTPGMEKVEDKGSFQGYKARVP